METTQQTRTHLEPGKTNVQKSHRYRIVDAATSCGTGRIMVHHHKCIYGEWNHNVKKPLPSKRKQTSSSTPLRSQWWYMPNTGQTSQRSSGGMKITPHSTMYLRPSTESRSAYQTKMWNTISKMMQRANFHSPISKRTIIPNTQQPFDNTVPDYRLIFQCWILNVGQSG